MIRWARRCQDLLSHLSCYAISKRLFWHLTRTSFSACSTCRLENSQRLYGTNFLKDAQFWDNVRVPHPAHIIIVESSITITVHIIDVSESEIIVSINQRVRVRLCLRSCFRTLIKCDTFETTFMMVRNLRNFVHLHPLKLSSALAALLADKNA